MELRETCQCRPMQGPAMKSRATADSSATESTYKVLKIGLARFSGKVAEMRSGTTVNDYKSFTEIGLNSLRNSVIQSPLAVSRVY